MSLMEVPTEDMLGLVRGALGVERTSRGLVPVRLPDWAWRHVPDLFTREVFRMPSGVRLALTTKATTLELDVAATRLKLDGVDESAVPVPPLVVDLFVDGQEHAEGQI